MNSYEAIYSRRSVRKYKMEPVAPELLEKVRKFIGNIVPLDKVSRVELEIQDQIRNPMKVKGVWKVEAPCYLLVYCEENPASYRNAGYVAEQAVLYMTAKGLGTCYLGETKTGSGEKNGLKRLLVIAFGVPDEKLYRDSEEAKRLSLNSLCVIKDEPGEYIKTILKAARLAPSSFNSQPWRFVAYSDRVYIFARKEMLPQPKIMGAMRDFNMGIMLSHIMLSAEEFWMNMETVMEEQFLKKAYKNGEHICTIIFHS